MPVHSSPSCLGTPYKLHAADTGVHCHLSPTDLTCSCCWWHDAHTIGGGQKHDHSRSLPGPRCTPRAQGHDLCEATLSRPHLWYQGWGCWRRLQPGTPCCLWFCQANPNPCCALATKACGCLQSSAACELMFCIVKLGMIYLMAHTCCSHHKVVSPASRAISRSCSCWLLWQAVCTAVGRTWQ